MVLVDTSIWVDHLRKGNRRLEQLLLDAEVVSHPYVIGELACGNIKNRAQVLSLLNALPLAPQVSFDECLYFIDQQQLYGTGLGFVDINLLASALLAEVPLWTNDKRLKKAAARLKIAYK